MRLFLGTHGACFAFSGVEKPRFLVDLTAVLENSDLALRLIVDGLAHEPDGVHVLDLAARTEFRAGTPDRHVDVGPQRALLHVAVAGAEVAHDLAKLGDIGLGLVGRAHVGLRDDFHQRAARTVQIDKAHAGVLVVKRLAGILFEMKPLDTYLDGAAIDIDVDRALAHDRLLVLRNLVALGKVGVEVILAVEDRTAVDLRLEAQTGTHRLLDAEFVDHRQHAGHRRVDQRHMIIGLAAELCRSTGEELGLGQHLGMDLHADDDFPIASGALDPVFLFSSALFGFVHGSPVHWRLANGKARGWQGPG
jgi:hypothetical protein